MRKVLAGVVAAVWLVASVVLWAGGFQLVPTASASGAIGLSVPQAVLLAYHLSDVLQTLVGAYLSLALAGLLSAIWLLIEGLVRRVRLASSLGGIVVVIEFALLLFTYLRVQLLLPIGPNAGGLLNASSIAGQLAAEMIPAALLLAVTLGAMSFAAQRAPDAPKSREAPANAEAHPDVIKPAKPTPEGPGAEESSGATPTEAPPEPPEEPDHETP